MSVVRTYSPFGPAFERGELAVPGYLTLLHLTSPGVQATIDRIEAALEDPEHAAGIRRLLAETNWRPHLVAATALLVLEDPTPFVDDLWGAIRRGSWVAPQLLVAASLVDPSFEVTARRRLADDCRVSWAPDSAMRSAKEASAIVELLGLDRETLDPGLQELLGDDVDDGAGLAAGWLAAIEERFAARGRALRRG